MKTGQPSVSGMAYSSTAGGEVPRLYTDSKWQEARDSFAISWEGLGGGNEFGKLGSSSW